MTELAWLFTLGVRFSHRENLWIAHLVDLMKFRAEYGHSNVSTRDPIYSSLGKWLVRQRTNREKLSSAQIRLLNELDVNWKPVDKATSEKWIFSLEQFYRENGHCNVPVNYPANPRLGNWVRRNRSRGNKLSLEQRARLDGLGFIWKLRKSPECHPWEWWFKKLVKFKKLHGHCNVSAYSETDSDLGIWVAGQRWKKNIKQSRKERLDEIGFSWAPSEEAWEIKLNELIDYKNQHGHWNVPQRCIQNHTLAVWLRNQRQHFSRGVLSPERAVRLAEIGVVWYKKRGTMKAEINRT